MWCFVIEGFQFSSVDWQVFCEIYWQVGYELYEVLLLFFEVQLELLEQLVIVLGGVLGFLFFDVFLMGLAGYCNFFVMLYLINCYEISYVYVVIFQCMVQQCVVKGKGFVAFVLDFDGRGGFGVLVYNQLQVVVVVSLFRGQVFLGLDVMWV